MENWSIVGPKFSGEDQFSMKKLVPRTKMFVTGSLKLGTYGFHTMAAPDILVNAGALPGFWIKGVLSEQIRSSIKLSNIRR